MKQVSLLTWNADKVRAAQPIFDKYGIQLNLLKPDIEEIQASTSIEVAKHTAIEMAKRYNQSVIREDHALYIKWIFWDSFPWPFTSYFDKRVTAQDLVNVLYGNEANLNGPLKEGYFELWCCFATPDGKTIENIHRVEIEISRVLKWDRGNFDKILMIKWSGKTFAECKEWENAHYFSRNFELIAEYIKNA